MRKNKFRVWDDIARKMWYPEEGLRACVTQVGSVCTDETDDGGILENRSYRLTALFYTGLKDSKGREVYEGDIVRLDGNAFVNHEVFWYEPTYQYLLRSTSPIHQTHLLGIAKDSEVIGSIYENKDLLEV